MVVRYNYNVVIRKEKRSILRYHSAASRPKMYSQTVQRLYLPQQTLKTPSLQGLMHLPSAKRYPQSKATAMIEGYDSMTSDSVH